VSTPSVQDIETALAVAVSYVGNPLSMWLAIQRKPFGWAIVAATQAMFVGFAIASGDWRFGGQVLCLAIAIVGVYLWAVRRTHEPAIGRAADDLALVAEDAVAELDHLAPHAARLLRDRLELAQR
jgi:hypothetical protein